MLVVTVELWPGGDAYRSQEIANVQIANISDLDEVSDYLVGARGAAEPRLGIERVEKSFTIEGHPRRQNVFKLLKKVFDRLGEDQ